MAQVGEVGALVDVPREVERAVIRQAIVDELGEGLLEPPELDRFAERIQVALDNAANGLPNGEA